MGRKKKYDRDTLIDRAMELFHDHGFAGSSTQMLVDELGVNRFSIYAEFGNKQNLFEVALDRYNNEVVDRNFGPLETATAGMKEIRELLLYFASASKGTASGRGCLLCNTAVEFGPADPSGTKFVQRYFTRMSNAYLNALNNAKGSGELQNTISIKEEADYFTASTLGLFVMLRAKVSPTIIKNAATMAIEHLDYLNA